MNLVGPAREANCYDRCFREKLIPFPRFQGKCREQVIVADNHMWFIVPGQKHSFIKSNGA